MIKKLILILILLLALPLLSWSYEYDVPVGWQFSDIDGVFKAPDSAWIIFQLKYGKQDSIRYTATEYGSEFSFDTVVAKSADPYDTATGFLTVIYNLFTDDTLRFGGSVTYNIATDLIRFTDSLDALISSVGGSLGSCPSAARTMTLVSIDTSGVDDTIPNIQFEILTMTGYRYTLDQTTANGRKTVPFTSRDTLVIYVYGQPDYNFPGETTATGIYIGFDTVFTGVNDTTIDLRGYDIDIGAPSAANTTRMYVYVYDTKGQPVKGADFISDMSVPDPPAYDTCVGFIPITRQAKTKTDSLGYGFLDLVESDCIEGSDVYTFTVKKGRDVLWIKNMAAPSGVDSAKVER